MHELVQNEKKKESSRARSLLDTRTGLNVNNENEEEKQQQKRIAARAATAMAQVLHRRREPRSLMMWGDRKKAIIKRYPDGRQEIIVPQTLTPEQEHYEFPPRSRFLKKLATSTAELRRLSVLQDHVVNTAPTATASSCTLGDPTMMKQPDQSSLQEWFSQKEKSAKDLQVIEWMNQVERSSKLQQKIKVSSPTPSVCYSNKIQFKSDAGKRWANYITSNASLIPPDDTSKKHYVPRRLLSNYHKSATMSEDPDKRMNDAVSQIQMIWKEYQSKSSTSNTQMILENKVGMTAMSSTGQRTPISGMMHLVQMLQHTLQVQQQKSNDRLAKLEYMLQEESKKRKEIEEQLYKERSTSLLTSTRKNPLAVRNTLSKDQLSSPNTIYKRNSSATMKPPLSSLHSSLTDSKKPSSKATTINKPVKKVSRPSLATDTTKPKSRDRTSSLANLGIKSTSKPSTPQLKRQKVISSSR